MNRIRNKKGITLIALVVTIVVLLILAGVSIAMLTGDNGIIKKSTESKDKNKLAQYEEEIRQIINEERIERSTKEKEESFTASVKLKIEEKEWTLMVSVYDENGEEQQGEYVAGNNQLIVETKDGYEITVYIDDKNNVNRIESEKLGEIVPRHTIKYDSNGASEGIVESHTNCKSGTSIKLRENGYKREGFAFCGWSKVNNTTKEKDIIAPGTTVQVEEDMTYYAIWISTEMAIGKTIKYKEYNWVIYGTNEEGKFLAKPTGTCGTLSSETGNVAIEKISSKFSTEGKVKAELFNYERSGWRNIIII